MTSTVILYKDSKIRPSKNFVFSSGISTYLSNVSKTIINGFQFIKHGLNIVIKIDESQYSLYDLNINNDLIDYVAIKNNNEPRYHYYFIMSKQWRSKNTIILSLSMDTLNTYVYGTDYSLDDKTVVNRQHKDRFIQSTDLAAVSYPTTISSIINNPYNLVVSKDFVWVDGMYAEIPESDEDGIRVMFWYHTENGGVENLEERMVVEQIQVTNLNGELYLQFMDHNRNVYRQISHSEYRNSRLLTITITFVINPEDYSSNIVNLFSTTYVRNVIRNIDLVSEGIAPVLYGTNLDYIEGDGQSWYLVYMGNPLRCYLTSDKGQQITVTTTKTISPSDLTAGRWYYILPVNNGGTVPVTINTASGNLSRPLYYKSKDMMVGLVFTTDGTNITCYTISWAWRPLVQAWGFPSRGISYTATSLSFADYNYSTKLNYYYNASEITSLEYNTIVGLSSAYFTFGTTTVTCKSISDLDRWEETLYKIIKLPYKPVQSFAGFKYDSEVNMVYVNLDTINFVNEITTEDSPYHFNNPLNNMVYSPAIVGNVNKKVDAESKLFHSDFFLYKFIYDSFSFEFNLELFDTSLVTNTTESEVLNIQYNVTTTINSRFMFTFTQWSTDGKSLQDYDNILVVSRNNELVIYNSTYLDYVKNGYNYDVKTRERQVGANWLGFGIGAITSGVSFATGNPVGLAAGVSLAGSTLGQLVGSINNTIQTEQSLQQKLIQLQNQKVSVNGADDVDLMSIYTNNKAKMMIYQVSDRMKTQLHDLFFYTGYADGRMMRPDLHTRTRFNFISCDPVFRGAGSNPLNISEDILEDMGIRFKTGVTFLHYYNGFYDIEQTYENWEVSLYE